MVEENEKQKRSVLNTTIDREVMEEFREHCNGMGLKMNVVIETFMRQFSNDEFVMKFAKNRINLDLEE